MAVNRNYLSVREAGRYLGLSTRTLGRYRRSGGGPAYHRFGGLVRYLRADLDDWAGARRRLAEGTARGGRVRRRRGSGSKAVEAPRDGSSKEQDEQLPSPAAGGGAAPAARDAAGTSGRRFLNAWQAARYVGYSPDTLKAMRSKGEGPGWSKAGRRVVYDVRELDAWVDRRRRRIPAGAVAA